MMISMVALVGCNGLWDFDDDDDVTLMPVKYSFKGSVNLGSALATGSVSIRAALTASDYASASVNVYQEDDRTGSNALNDESITVDSTGQFDVIFNASNGTAFYIKITKSGYPTLYRFFGSKTSTEMENDYGTTPAETNEKTTVVGLILIQDSDLKYGTDISEADSAIYDGTSGLADDFATYINNYDPTAPASFTLTVAVESVTIDQDSPVSLEFGKTTTLTATVAPDYATNKTVTWSSDNTSIATVDSSGVVTANSTTEGSANITATAGGVTSTAVVVNVKSGPVAVTGVSVTPTSATVGVGKTQQLTAAVAPANADDTSVSWSSSNESVATVDSNGLVTGVAEGDATITVTTTDGSYTATCAISVVTGTTVTFSSTISGATTAMTIVLRGAGDNYSGTTTLKAIDDSDVLYEVDSTSSSSLDDGVILKFASVKTLADFNSMTFSSVLPSGTTVQLAGVTGNPEVSVP
jgi:uncharacterized protein YjdB